MPKNKENPEHQEKQDNENKNETTERKTLNPIQYHYIKDMSLENPSPAKSFEKQYITPSMKVDLGVESRDLDLKEMPRDKYSEVTLNCRVTASQDDYTAFILEVSYATLVVLDGLPEDKIHPFLHIEVPRIVFPFVRQLIADITHQAGYSPVFLTPVDFQGLYIHKFWKPGSEKQTKEKTEATES